MCAILGVFTNSDFEPDSIAKFKKALELTSHRGPDISNELFFKNALLGFNRLSIVGVANGSQPFLNEDASVFLLCNGEIYNHLDLRKELADKHRFLTDSDCEVILHGYEEDPKNFPARLRGQFSFLIFDKNRNRLILSRDRFGINPLFYGISNSQLIVSSEIKSILALDSSISAGLDPIGLKETFFLYGPTPPRTCFQNIFQAEPGKILTFDLEKNEIIENKRYWNLPKVKIRKNKEIVKEFSRLLEKAVDLRIQGDVPNASVYLSGGLDSASIASLLRKLGHLPNVFSIAFHDPKLDESHYQKKIANFLKIPLFSLFGDELFDSNLFQTIWHTEHPLIRTAPLPLYSLSHLVRAQGNKFVCCGEGADETLLGYPVFAEKLCSIEDKLPEYSELEKLFGYSEMTGRNMVAGQMTSTLNDWNVAPNSIRHKQLIEMQTKLTRYLLVQQGDRQSMSHGVEQRFPFLDEDLVDFLFSLPADWFEKNCMNKKLLKKAMNKLLPQIILRRKKQGYLAPMDRQLYESVYFSQLIESADTERFALIMGNYYAADEVRKLVRDYRDKSLNETNTIGILLVMSTYILHRQFYGDLT